MKAALLNLALTLVSLLVGLAICEAGLRVAGFRPGNPFERLINHYDEYLGYHLVPGMHESIPGPDGVYAADIVSLGFDDGVGFRDDGITPPVDSVFIGDSFVWGFGVELPDSVSERYERLTGGDAVNLGMTSWTSPTQYARILAKYGVKLRPKTVFMEALVENDFGDSPNFAAWEASGTAKSYPEWTTDRVMGYQPDSFSYTLRRFLYDHSALARLISDRVHFGFKDPTGTTGNDVLHVIAGGLDLDLDKRELPAPGEMQDGGQIAMFRTALEYSKETAEKNGIRLVVFIIPTKEMVYQDRFAYPALRAAVDWRYAALLQLLAQTGIEHVDLLPPLRQVAATGKQLYFAHDTHWNALGHDVAARALAAFMAASQGTP